MPLAEVIVGVGSAAAAASRTELGVGRAWGKGRGGAEHVEHRPDGGVGRGLGRRAPGVRDSWARGAGFVLSGRFCSRKYGGRVIPSAAA